MNKIKLAVFDLDGTLVNSLEDLACSANEALAQLGFCVHEIPEYRYFVGNGAAKMAERILPEAYRTQENIDKALELFSRAYSKRYKEKTRPYDGIEDTLRRLRAAGVITAVASNKPDEFTQRIVSELLGGLIDIAMGKKPELEKKPDPGIVSELRRQAAELLGTAPENDEIIFIGDSSVDIETAHNAGVKSIGCTWGFRTEDELVKSGADHIAHSPDEICDIINLT